MNLQPLPTTGSQASNAVDAHPGDLFFDIAAFLVGATLVAGVALTGVPTLSAHHVEPLVAWMCLAVPLVFVPLIFVALLLLRTEAVTSWRDRLRLHAPSRQDWRWGLGGLVLMAALSAPLALLGQALGLPTHPSTIPPPAPLTTATLWMVGIWLVYWPFNILGEEFIWRGVLLPRMERRFGRHAWALNGALWFVFHLAFGPGNLLVLVPTLALVPYVAQRRRNTWLAVLLHAGLSGPGFVAMALGAV